LAIGRNSLPDAQAQDWFDLDGIRKKARAVHLKKLETSVWSAYFAAMMLHCARDRGLLTAAGCPRSHVSQADGLERRQYCLKETREEIPRPS